MFLFRREPEILTEGQEPEEFWEAIGGREQYASGKILEVRIERGKKIKSLFSCFEITMIIFFVVAIVS